MFWILSGCSMEWWLQAIVDGDAKHAQDWWSVVMTAQALSQKISSSGHVDLSNLDLWEIPDFCGLLQRVDLNKIVSVDLSNNNIQKVSGLNCLPSLKDLNLSDNQIDSLLWFPLMANLEKLNLARNQLKDLNGVNILKWVIELQLWENFLENLAGLEELKNLQKLWVELNKLKDLDVLQYLDQLKEVNAQYNELKDTAQQWLEKIPWVSL